MLHRRGVLPYVRDLVSRANQFLLLFLLRAERPLQHPVGAGPGLAVLVLGFTSSSTMNSAQECYGFGTSS